MKNISLRKMIILLIVIIIALIIWIAGSINIDRAGKTMVEISVFPGDSLITINDETYKPGKIYLNEGLHSLVVSKDGFSRFTKTIDLKKDDQTIAVILSPESKEALEWSKQHESEYRKVQAKSEIAAAEAGKRFNKLNPIARHLPYKSFTYSIGHRMDTTDPSGNSIIVVIDAPEGYRQSALYHIRKLGQDPTDLTIDFINYENPFTL